MKYFYTLFLFLIITSCTKQEKKLTAQEIIDKSILASGTHKLSNATLQFNFRDKLYTAKRTQGKFTFTRKFDSKEDVLSNSGFQRFINNKKISLKDSLTNTYANAVNSVHYFSVLPFGLNDKAVVKKLLPSSIIQKKEYFKVQITFSENGGGEDFEDVFIYWIDKKNFLVDYLAYAYQTNGGGKRFRAIIKENYIDGIRFADYNNYKPLVKNSQLISLDKAFENNQLEKVSEIVLSDLKVNVLN